MITGWRYWWRRLLGWFPLQPCVMCTKWYWGGLPSFSWQACYQEYCSKKCSDEGDAILERYMDMNYK